VAVAFVTIVRPQKFVVKFRIAIPANMCYSINKEEIIMGTKVKPVQPTVVKDKAIVEQIIKEIRRQHSNTA
jgi:hypothetical protein